MKKLFLLLSFLSVFCYSQNVFPTKFEVSKEGFTDFTVINLEGKTKEEIYTKTLEWINKTYNNPKEVIKAEILNDYVRIEGIVKNFINTKSSVLSPGVFYDSKYQIEIHVKEGKYKFDIIDVKISGNGYQWYSFQNASIFNKKGEINNMWDKESILKTPNYFNSLNDDLKDFILNGSKTSTSNDW